VPVPGAVKGSGQKPEKRPACSGRPTQPHATEISRFPENPTSSLWLQHFDSILT
jgi:hypothetical protein